MPTKTTPLDAEAARFERIAAELDRASAHCRTTARHYRDEEVPRAAAHAWAATGHLEVARRELADNAVIHAERSSPD